MAVDKSIPKRAIDLRGEQAKSATASAKRVRTPEDGVEAERAPSPAETNALAAERAAGRSHAVVRATALLERIHQPRAQAGTERIDARDASRGLAALDSLSIADGAIRMGTASGVPIKIPIPQVDAKALTLTGSAQVALSAALLGLRQRRATLLSAGPGAGVGHTARWLGRVLAEKHEQLPFTGFAADVRLAPTTTVESLTGAQRLSRETGGAVVDDGPLTHAVRHGGVVVLTGVEAADPSVLTLLRELAEGAAVITHPASGDLIRVHDGFRMLLVADPAGELPPALVSACQSARVPALDAAGITAVVVEQVGLPPKEAALLAQLHMDIVAATKPLPGADAARLNFGHQFPLGIKQLLTVARRARAAGSLSAAGTQALLDVYGAQLKDDASRTQLKTLCASAGLSLRASPAAPASVDASFVELAGHAEARRQFADALRHGETVMVSSAPQGGGTRLISDVVDALGDKLVTVPAQRSSDPNLLLELNDFDEKGRPFIRDGILAQALAEGATILIDHLDFIPTERQRAFFELARARTVRVLRTVTDAAGNTREEMVEVPVDPRRRIVLSTTRGNDPGMHRPSPRDVAGVTVVNVPPPTAADAAALLSNDVFAHAPKALRAELRASVLEALAAHNGARAPKLQRALDFARAAALVAGTVTGSSAQVVARATRIAADLVLQADAAVLLGLDARAGATRDDAPLWMQLLKVTEKDVRDVERVHGVAFLASMTEQLDKIAIAVRLGRPIWLHGPASVGKTSSAQLVAALLGKAIERVSFSIGTSAQDLLSTYKATDDGGYSRGPGALPRAGKNKSVVIFDEMNLSPDAYLALMAAFGARGMAIDPESNTTTDVSGAIIIGTGNNLDGKHGRRAIAPVALDCMFCIEMKERSPAEKVQVIAKGTKQPPEMIRAAVEFFTDLEAATRKRPASTVTGSRARGGDDEAPQLKTNIVMTATERDIMRKAMQAADHYIARDKVTSQAERRKIVARETFRAVRGLLTSEQDQELAFGFLRKHFGADAVRPAAPQAWEFVEAEIDGRSVLHLQIGAARYPVRDLTKTPELQRLVPSRERDKLKDPTPSQLAQLEDVLTAIELGQSVMLLGVPGAGKTMLLRWIAHLVNVPFLELNGDPDMLEGELLGTALKAGGALPEAAAPLRFAMEHGCWFNLDESLVLNSGLREVLNGLTEGREITFPGMPPVTFHRENWPAGFRYSTTTNAGKIRAHGVSPPEASRYRAVTLNEIEDPAELQTIAARDRLAAAPEPFALNGIAPRDAAEAAPVRAAFSALLTRVGGGRAEAVRLALEGNPRVAETERDGGTLSLDADDVVACIDMLRALPALGLRDAHKRAALRDIAALLEEAPSELRARARQTLQAYGILTQLEVDGAAFTPAAWNGRVVDAGELARAVNLFVELRGLQRTTPGSPTPLTLRLFGAFLEAYTRMRESDTHAGALARAAGLALFSALPPDAACRQAARELVQRFAGADRAEVPARMPVQGVRAVRFGNTWRRYRDAELRAPDHARFPLTEERCRDLALRADALEYGGGAPVLCVNDENGEELAGWLELGYQSATPASLVSLSKDRIVDDLIESLVPAGRGARAGTFMPEVQLIAAAIERPGILIICVPPGTPPDKLERLNSLFDHRRRLRLPHSGHEVDLHPDARIVILASPGAAVSSPIQNRKVEPQLSTRVPELMTEEVRTAELARTIAKRTGVSVDEATLVAVFHLEINALIARGRFGGTSTTLIERDAVAAARSLRALKDNAAGLAADEALAMREVLLSVYGGRFRSAADAQLFDELVAATVGGVQGRLAVSHNIVPVPGVERVRIGEWILTRGDAAPADLPPRNETLPASPALDGVLLGAARALSGGEVVHLVGDSFVARATATKLARETNRPLIRVPGSRALNPALLFGGSVQNEETGAWEWRDGAIKEAQDRGAVLLIENAADLMPAVQQQLWELAATHELQLTRRAATVRQPITFPLLLQTGGKPPLSVALERCATPVACDALVADDSLEPLLRHALVGVPGGEVLAGALARMVPTLDALLRAEPSGRQRLQFDAVFAIETARAVCRAVAAGSTAQDAVVEALAGRVLSPTRELRMAAEARALVDAALKELEAAGLLSSLVADDEVKDPVIAQLLADFEPVRSAFTNVVLDGIKAALSDGRAADALVDAFEAIASSPAVPRTVRDRARRATTAAPAARAAEALALVTLAQKYRAPASVSLGDAALAFLRGARLIDVDERYAMVDAHRALLARLGSASVEEHVGALTAATARFDALGARRTIDAVRNKMDRTLQTLRTASEGRGDSGVARIENAWSVLCTSPLFREHHILRAQGAALEALCAQLGVGGDAADGGLTREIRDLSGQLETLRIAEQSSDLRSALSNDAARARGTLEALQAEVATIRALEVARLAHEQLDAEEKLAVHLESGTRACAEVAVAVRPSALASPAEIEAAVAEEVARERDAELETLTAAAMRKLADAASAMPPPAQRTIDLSDLRLPGAPARNTVSKRRARYAAAMDAAGSAADTFAAKRRPDLLAAAAKRAESDAIERTLAALRHALARDRTDAERENRALTSRISALAQGTTNADADPATRAAATSACADALRALDANLAAVAEWHAAAEKAGQAWRKRGQLAAPLDIAPLADRAVGRKVGAALNALRASHAARRSALPRRTKLEERKQVRDGLLRDLLAARTLGELSTKVAHARAVALSADDRDLKVALQATLTTLGDGTGALLHALAAFVAATTELAGEETKGDAALAAAVTATVGAMDAFLKQDVDDRDFKAAARKLDVAGKQLSALRAPSRSVVETLAALEQLRARAAEESVEPMVNADRVTAVLSRLSAAFASRVDGGAAPVGSPRAIGRARVAAEPARLASASQLLDMEVIQGAGRRRLSGPLRVRDVVTVRVEAYEYARSFSDAAPSADAPRHWAEIRGLTGEAINLGARRADWVGHVKAVLSTDLDALEARAAHAGVMKLREQLEDAGARLKGIVDRGGVASRDTLTVASRVLDLLRRAERAALIFGDSGRAAAAELAGAVQAASALGAHVRSDTFFMAAHTWALTAQAAVATALRALPEPPPAGDADPAVLARLHESVAELAAFDGRLGAASAAALADAAAASLAAMRQGLLDDAPAVDGLIEKLRAQSTALAERAAASAESALTDVLAGVTALGAAAGKSPQCGAEMVAAFRALLESLRAFDAVATDEPLDCLGRMHTALTRMPMLDADVVQAVSEVRGQLEILSAAVADARRRAAYERLERGASAQADEVIARRSAFAEAIDAFLSAATEEERTETADRARAELVALHAAATGPAVVVLAETVLHVRSLVLEENSAVGRAARTTLLDALAPFIRMANGVVADLPDAFSRYQTLRAALAERVAPDNESKPTVEWIEGVTAAFAELARAKVGAVKADLDALQAEWFDGTEAALLSGALVDAETDVVGRDRPSGEGRAAGQSRHAERRSAAEQARFAPRSSRAARAAPAEIVVTPVDAAQVRRIARAIRDGAEKNTGPNVGETAGTSAAPASASVSAAADFATKIRVEGAEAVETIASVLTRFAGTEIGVGLDQSGSTQFVKVRGVPLIDPMSRIGGAVLAATIDTEGACFALGTGLGLCDEAVVWRGDSDQGPSKQSEVYLYHAISEPLDEQAAAGAFGRFRKGAEFEALVGMMGVAAGQFTQALTLKAFVMITDARTMGVDAQRRMHDAIAAYRDKGITLCILAFGPDASWMRKSLGEDAIGNAFETFLQKVPDVARIAVAPLVDANAERQSITEPSLMRMLEARKAAAAARLAEPQDTRRLSPADVTILKRIAAIEPVGPDKVMKQVGGGALAKLQRGDSEVLSRVDAQHTLLSSIVDDRGSAVLSLRLVNNATGATVAEEEVTVLLHLAEHCETFEDASKKIGPVLGRALVDNATFRGQVDAAANGVGLIAETARFEAAKTIGATATARRMTQVNPTPEDESPIVRIEGAGVEEHDLATEDIYAGELMRLENEWRHAKATPAWRDALVAVRQISEAQAQEGLSTRLPESQKEMLPVQGSLEVLRRQTSGSLDSAEVPRILFAQQLGLPPPRDVKKRLAATEGVVIRVVLAIDESTSMDPEKQATHLKGLLAYGDALKAAYGDKIQIAVVGFSDRVRLHKGFEQKWDDEAKAHLLVQAGRYRATNDKRCILEAGRLIHMQIPGIPNAEYGHLAMFSDGVGKPDAPEAMRELASHRTLPLIIGIGPRTAGVLRYDEDPTQNVYAIHIASLAQLPGRISSTGVRGAANVGGVT